VVDLSSIPFKVRCTCSSEDLVALSARNLKGPGSSEGVVAPSAIPFKVRGTCSSEGLVALLTRRHAWSAYPEVS
jgi:hypothetical protein